MVSATIPPFAGCCRTADKILADRALVTSWMQRIDCLAGVKYGVFRRQGESLAVLLFWSLPHNCYYFGKVNDTIFPISMPVASFFRFCERRSQ